MGLEVHVHAWNGHHWTVYSVCNALEMGNKMATVPSNCKCSIYGSTLWLAGSIGPYFTILFLGPGQLQPSSCKVGQPNVQLCTWPLTLIRNMLAARGSSFFYGQSSDIRALIVAQFHTWCLGSDTELRWWRSQWVYSGFWIWEPDTVCSVQTVCTMFPPPHLRRAWGWRSRIMKGPLYIAVQTRFLVVLFIHLWYSIVLQCRSNSQWTLSLLLETLLQVQQQLLETPKRTWTENP